MNCTYYLYYGEGDNPIPPKIYSNPKAVIDDIMQYLSDDYYTKSLSTYSKDVLMGFRWLQRNRKIFDVKIIIDDKIYNLDIEGEFIEPPPECLENEFYLLFRDDIC